jgi:hypothetical protein
MLACHRANEDPSPCPLPAKPGRGKRIGLANRVLNEQVLADVEKHTLIYPIEHGAAKRKGTGTSKTRSQSPFF